MKHITQQLRAQYFEATGLYGSDAEILKWGSDTDDIVSANITPSYYGAKCKCGLKMDPYAICDAYDNVQASAHHHALKKLLRAGEGHKALQQDIREVIDSLTRWEEQLTKENNDK